jgi:hypothetical protein
VHDIPCACLQTLVVCSERLHARYKLLCICVLQVCYVVRYVCLSKSYGINVLKLTNYRLVRNMLCMLAQEPCAQLCTSKASCSMVECVCKPLFALCGHSLCGTVCAVRSALCVGYALLLCVLHQRCWPRSR